MIFELTAFLYGSANIFETQNAMEWPTKKYGNTPTQCPGLLVAVYLMSSCVNWAFKTLVSLAAHECQKRPNLRTNSLNKLLFLPFMALVGL
jgi:hypothetical protein